MARLDGRSNYSWEVEGMSELLVQHMSAEDADRLMNEKSSVILRYAEGFLYAVEVPHLIHGLIASEIFVQLYQYRHLDAVCNVPVLNDSSHIWVTNVAVVPWGDDGRLIGGFRPTIVAEVGAQESLQSLFKSATTYLTKSDSIQGVLAIKVWNPSPHDDDTTRAMLCMFFDRASPSGYTLPVQVVSFGHDNLHRLTLQKLIAWGVPSEIIRGKFAGSGDPNCTGPAQPLYELSVSASTVFRGCSNIPAHGGFTIDLYALLWQVAEL